MWAKNKCLSLIRKHMHTFPSRSGEYNSAERTRPQWNSSRLASRVEGPHRSGLCITMDTALRGWEVLYLDSHILVSFQSGVLSSWGHWETRENMTLMAKWDVSVHTIHRFMHWTKAASIPLDTSLCNLSLLELILFFTHHRCLIKWLSLGRPALFMKRHSPAVPSASKQ